ncbi:arylamine N-acetyltransferase family protein [Kribbella sp. DT2]|uniref:arylamine N-acetyltransferase family protein n=1 Tax=Kribbella sp. DT2 TaxID=3393427 RepID=UPI003CEFC63E
MTTSEFLRRIGLEEAPAGPSVEGLFALQRAFVVSVPYESIQYQLGRGGPLDQRAVVERMITREAGGYCFQMNGAFGWLLDELGYDVTMHRGGVQTRTAPEPRVDSTHLVLTVTGLPEEPERVWLVDAGLGDGFLEPMPLEVGATSRQTPYGFSLGPSSITTGWRLEHDARSVIAGMDFEAAPATIGDFAEQHAYLSTSPSSPFVRVASAFLRRPESALALRSTELAETFADRIDTTLLETPAEYYAVLADVFQLPLQHLTAADRDQLWRRVVEQYESYQARIAAAGDQPGQV